MINEQELDEKIELLEREITSGRSRFSSDRMDISYGELINLYKNRELVIRPEYQRLFRWTPEQKTALIESVLLSIPIPPIFVAEDENGVWELVDGLQRLATFISFFGELITDVSKFPEIPSSNTIDSDNIDDIEEQITIEIGNKWFLKEGGLINSLSGFNIENLPSKFRINLKRAVCRVEILRGESNTAMKYELFKRLNSGGSKLTPQEIRNAIYRGVSPKINELILELSKNIVFQNLCSFSNKKKQELYDQELVLKFIAFLDNSENINGNSEHYLNIFMEKAVNNESFNLTYYRDKFNKVMNLLESTNNPKIFRNHLNSFVPALFEGVTIGLAQNLNKYENNIALLLTNINNLKNDLEFKKYSGSSSNSKSRIQNRLRIANEFLK